MQLPATLPDPFYPAWEPLQIPVGQVSHILANGLWLIGGWSLATTGGTGAATLYNGDSNNGRVLADIVIDSNLGAQFAAPWPGILAESGIFYTTTDAINVGVIYACHIDI